MYNERYTKEDDDCSTYFGINIEKANKNVKRIISECIFKEKHPNY